MSLNGWLAERYTPSDVLALGAVGSAILVGALALAQGIELVPGTEAIGLIITGGLFLVGFGAAIGYINQKNREAFYGTPLDIRWDHENGQIVLDEAMAIKVRLYEDGLYEPEVETFGYTYLGDGAHGWYVEGDDPENGDLCLDISIGEPV